MHHHRACNATPHHLLALSLHLQVGFWVKRPGMITFLGSHAPGAC